MSCFDLNYILDAREKEEKRNKQRIFANIMFAKHGPSIWSDICENDFIERPSDVDDDFYFDYMRAFKDLDKQFPGFRND